MHKNIYIYIYFSSFKLGLLIPNGETLQQSLLQLVSNYKHPDGCTIRVDNAPGFQSLRNDMLLNSLGITFEFGQEKNKNHNPTVDKTIQEIEEEIKRLSPHGGLLNPGLLETAIGRSNNRVRANGFSSKEVFIKRDNYTGESINVDDYKLIEDKRQRRYHIQSERAKSQGAKSLPVEAFAIGQLVHIKIEGSKHVARDRYIATSIDKGKQEAMAEIWPKINFDQRNIK